MEYRREIDGLRAIAVIPVILFHTGIDVFSGGFIGVDVFFVISGYLITSIILNEKEQGRFSIVNFYERRARRILPALFFVMFISVPFAWFLLLPDDLEGFSESLIAVSFFVSNILFWQESGYFETASELKPLLHTWSLAIEEQYYVLFPLFLMLVWWLRKRWVSGAIIFIGIISLMLSQWSSQNIPSANYYLLPTRAWELMIGASIAFFFLYGTNKKDLVNNNKLISEILALTGLILICYSIVFFDEKTPFPSLYALVPTTGAALIILFTSSATKLGKLLSARVLVGIGLVSYSAYLWHQPLFAFSRYKIGGDLSQLVLAILILLTFLFAFISWRYIEKPFRNKVVVSRKKIFLFSISGTAFFVLIGWTGDKLDGISPILHSDVLKRVELVKFNYDDRQSEIKAGICHYNKTGLYKDIDSFLKNWSCVSGDEDSLLGTQIGVFGDSHSADKAIALKQNGFDVVQLSGSECPLAPSAITEDYSYCKSIYYKFNEIKGINTVVIANRFKDDELTITNIKDILQYWSVRYEKVVLFSPMPEFYNAHLNYMRSGIFSKTPSLNYHNRFYDLIKHIKLPKNVIIINTKSLLCGDMAECSAIHDDNLMLTDYGHLTVYGARIFGERLIDSMYWESIITN